MEKDTKLPPYKNAEGVKKLLSAVVASAIRAYLIDHRKSKELTHKLDTFEYVDVVKFKKDKTTQHTTPYILTAKTLRKQDELELMACEGEMAQIENWLLSSGFKKLYGEEINGKYVYEKLIEARDKNVSVKSLAKDILA